MPPFDGGGGGGGGGGSCCRSPKSPGLFLVSGIRSKQMLVSLLAIACGLFLLLRNPVLLESERWRPVVFPQGGHALMSDPVDDSNSTKTATVTNNGRNSATASCDLSQGQWIPDETKPIYTGKHCSRWLSRPWRCRLDKQHNVSYERYRWKPSECDLPVFDSSQLLHRMRNKTIAFVGDSLGRQQFQSLICMLAGDKPGEIKDVSIDFGLASKGEGAYRFQATKTTVLFHWSATLGQQQPLKQGNWAVHVDRPPGFLAENGDRLDVVVVNTGHHWNRGKLQLNNWTLHVDGKVAGRMKVDVARRIALESTAQWLGEHSDRIRGFVRSLSPRHFHGGEWNTGGRCDGIREIGEKEEFREDLAARDAVMKTNGAVTLLEIGRLSWPRGEAHVSSASTSTNSATSLTMTKQDCLHWCLPGVPDTWNELLFAHLM